MEKQTGKLTALLGSVDMQITFQDGTTGGVRVKQLSIRELGAYAIAAEDDVKCLALFTGCTEEWVQKFTTDSALDVLEKGHELNAGFLERHAGLRTRVREKMLPGYQDLIQRMALQAMEKTQAAQPPLPTSAPVSPSTPV